MSDGKVTIRPTADGGLLLHVPMLMRKRFGRKLIIAPEGLDGSNTGDHRASQERLVAILARAHAWTRLLDEGKYGSTKQLADALGKDPSYVARVLRLATLAPDIIEAIFNGEEPNGLSLSKLVQPFPDDWSEQRKHFGFETSEMI